MSIAGAYLFDPLSLKGVDYRIAAHERDEALAALADDKSRDLDETRRLLYMALAAFRTDRYNLVGTLVNALAHHQGTADAIEALEKLVDAVEGGADGLAWVRARLAALDE